MTSPLLLLDENLSPETVRRLQAEGYAAVWLTEFVPLGSSDAEIALAAVEADAVIVTQDLDFAEAFFFGNAELVGTVVLRLRIQTVEQVNSRLLEFLKTIEARQIDLRSALFIVEETRFRVRK